MLCSAKADSLGAKVAGNLSIFWCVGIGAHTQLSNFISPFHDPAKITGDCWLDGWDLALHYLARAAVKGYPIPFFDHGATDAKLFFFVADIDVAAASYAAFSHPS